MTNSLLYRLSCAPLASVLLVALISASNAQPIWPSTEQFMSALSVCALDLKVELKGDIQGSIRSFYESTKTQGQISNSTTSNFIGLFPQTERLNAYKLYTECVLKIITMHSSVRGSRESAPEVKLSLPLNICDEREGLKCGAFVRESKVCFQPERVTSFMNAETTECTLSIFSRSQIVSAGWNLQKLGTFKSEQIKKDAPCIELAVPGVSISELRTKIACQ
jgi:hypothetical protein